VVADRLAECTVYINLKRQQMVRSWGSSRLHVNGIKIIWDDRHHLL
jgi:hypothetical protein